MLSQQTRQQGRVNKNDNHCLLPKNPAYPHRLHYLPFPLAILKDNKKEKDSWNELLPIDFSVSNLFMYISPVPFPTFAR